MTVGIKHTGLTFTPPPPKKNYLCKADESKKFIKCSAKKNVKLFCHASKIYHFTMCIFNSTSIYKYRYLTEQVTLVVCITYWRPYSMSKMLKYSQEKCWKKERWRKLRYSPEKCWTKRESSMSQNADMEVKRCEKFGCIHFEGPNYHHTPRRNVRLCHHLSMHATI